MSQEPRDYITVEDAAGNRKEYAIEALFDMENESYALLVAEDETIVMKVEGDQEDQYLVGISNPTESQAILDAYQIAVENAPAE
jgi:IMP cyclohydrolase